MFYVAFVFFSFSGNYKFLLTYDYWFTTMSTTGVAIFLRWLYSDRGVEVELEHNEKITAKEQLKSILIKKVVDNQLTDKLEVAILKRNQENKLKAYHTKCDVKINYLKIKAWYKLFRKKRLQYWKDRKDEIGNDDFNIDAIRKVRYYRFSIDDVMSSFYKENKYDRTTRRTKNSRVVNSLRANVLTVVVIGCLKGMELFWTDFTREDIIVLIGQILTFLLNIYNGYNLGRLFIKEDYSSNLSEDYSFLEYFLNQQVDLSK